jgi:hypothetical protein
VRWTLRRGRRRGREKSLGCWKGEKGDLKMRFWERGSRLAGIGQIRHAE